MVRRGVQKPREGVKLPGVQQEKTKQTEQAGGSRSKRRSVSTSPGTSGSTSATVTKSPMKKRRGRKSKSKLVERSQSTSRRNSQKNSAESPKRRYRPPSFALKEIRVYQTTTNLLIPRLPFQRLVKDITWTVTGSAEIRYQGMALTALNEAAEAFIVGLFEDSYLLSLHAKRVTLMDRDLQLALRIRGNKGL